MQHMKQITNLIFVLIIFLSVNQLPAQTLKYSDIGINKPEGKFKEYITNDGMTFRVGDTIVLGKGTGENGTFIHLLNEGSILPASFSGYRFVIESIFPYGNKSIGWKAKIMTNKLTRLGAPIYFFPEDIVCTGELVGYGMSTDEALKELRRCKEKLDLELISREEYEKIKAELSGFIK